MSGCAAAPPGPRGPLLGRGVELGGDWSYAHGRGEGTVATGEPTGGSSDNLWADLTIIPRRVEGRLAPLDYLDAGGQIGWLGGGLDLRLGLPATSQRALSFNLAAGFERGQPGTFVDARPTHQAWVRAEAYPALRAASDLRLIVAVGANRGTFYHELEDPRPLYGDGFGPDTVHALRPETRLETSLGVFFYEGRAGSFLFTASPYFVLDSGPVEQGTLATYEQSWGIVFVTRGALRKSF